MALSTILSLQSRLLSLLVKREWERNVSCMSCGTLMTFCRMDRGKPRYLAQGRCVPQLSALECMLEAWDNLCQRQPTCILLVDWIHLAQDWDK